MRGWMIGLACALAPGMTVFSQWTVVPAAPAEIAALPAFVRAEAGAVVRIDWDTLDAALAAAPADDAGAQGAPLLLPMPDGGLAEFRVYDSPVMEAALAAKFPEIKTYRVEGVTDPHARGRIDITPHGLRGFIRTDAGSVFIDPYSAQQREYASVYFLHDQLTMHARGGWACGVGHEHGEGDVAGEASPDAGGEPEGPGLVVRTYRMAMACTGEYGAFHSQLQGHTPNATDALGAIVTVVNRCNVTFEVDLGVRFLLVANNNLLAFFDPATDPYPDSDPACISNPAADCSGPYHNVNQSVINNIIGFPNYDVGHVLTRIRGGVASLRSVCGSNKARGVSGIPRAGDLDPVSALVPMHELGHQFGANHTFSGVRGRCNGGNLSGATAWEPGSGSTIMAYTGACPVDGGVGPGSDNIQLYADPYFNSGNIEEMRAFLAGPNSQCSVSIPTSNAAPQITSIPSSVLVPPSTPFTVSLAGADDSGTFFTNWEERDTGPARQLEAPDNGDSPIWRSWPPSAEVSRTFPVWSDIVGQTRTPGERLPEIPSQRRLHATLRDGLGGVTISSAVEVLVTGTQPFWAQGPETAVLGATMTVAWNVGDTASAPFGVSAVRIELSPDGSPSFPINLGDYPNTGSATVGVPPGLTTNTARLRITPLDGPPGGHAFFAVSNRVVIGPLCDPIDYNNDGLFPDNQDLIDFLSVFSGGPCPTVTCNDIDFNNDGLFPDNADIEAMFAVFGGGAC